MAQPLPADLADYERIGSLIGKIEWLKDRGEEVDPLTLYKSAEQIHRIYDRDSILEITHLGTEKLNHINSLQHYNLYGAYLVYDKEVRELTTVPDYVPFASCFSFALMKGVAKKHSLIPRDEIEFLEATISNEDGGTHVRTVFRVIKSNVFYNFSDEPKAVDDHDPR